MKSREKPLKLYLEMFITDKDVTAYIRSKYVPADEDLVPFRNVGERDRIPIILKETESVLSMILDLSKPDKIFEIGTAIGYSSAFFALKRPEAKVYTVEKDEYCYNAAKKNLETAGVSDRVRCYLGDGSEIADRLYDEGERDFDLVFIDASKSNYRRFLDSVTRIVKDGAVIISDNVLQHGMTCHNKFDPKNKHKTNIVNMKDYIDHLLYDRHLDTTIMSVGDGLAVSIYKEDIDG